MGIGYSQSFVTSTPSNIPVSSSAQQAVTTYQNLYNCLHSLASQVAMAHFSVLTPTVPVNSSVPSSTYIPPSYPEFPAQQPNVYSLPPQHKVHQTLDAPGQLRQGLPNLQPSAPQVSLPIVHPPPHPEYSSQLGVGSVTSGGGDPSLW